MPSTCHWITCAAAAAEKPQKSIASGVAFIASTMRPWPMAVMRMAARSIGRASSTRIWAQPRATAGGAAPSRKRDMAATPHSASTAIAR